jgi:hypothetical protein
MFIELSYSIRKIFPTPDIICQGRHCIFHHKGEKLRLGKNKRKKIPMPREIPLNHPQYAEIERHQSGNTQSGDVILERCFYSGFNTFLNRNKLRDTGSLTTNKSEDVGAFTFNGKYKFKTFPGINKDSIELTEECQKVISSNHLSNENMFYLYHDNSISFNEPFYYLMDKTIKKLNHDLANIKLANKIIKIEIGYGLIPLFVDDMGTVFSKKLDILRKKYGNVNGLNCIFHIRDNMNLDPYNYKIIINGIIEEEKNIGVIWLKLRDPKSVEKIRKKIFTHLNKMIKNFIG